MVSFQNIRGERRKMAAESYLSEQVKQSLRDYHWEDIIHCNNCDHFGFPCLNCAEFYFRFELGEGHEHDCNMIGCNEEENNE